MQFIVEQQAQLTASMQKHDEQLAKNDAQIAALTTSMQKHDEQIGALTNLVGRLAQAEIRLVERMENMEGRLQDIETRQDNMQVAMTRLFTVLGKVAEELRSKYPSSVWASKAIPWLPQPAKQGAA